MTATRSRPTAARTALGTVLTAGALLAAAPASQAAVTAPVLYGATGATADDTTPPSNLYTIDANTGAATSVGAIGRSITGLAWDPVGDKLYAVTAGVSESNTQRSLLTVNPANGASAVVGSIGTNNIEDIAFNQAGQLFGWNESGDDLVTINKSTGAVSKVGESGLGVTFGSGISFNGKDGQLFGMLDGDFGRLSTINPATGAVTEVARLNGSPISSGAAMSAAAFACDGTSLYSVVNDFGAPPTHLVTVNTANGKITNRGTTVTALDALAFACPPPAGPGPRKLGPAISRNIVKISKKRFGVIKLRCPASTGSTCRATLRVEKSDRILAKRTFSTAADQFKRIRIRVTKAGYRRIAKSGSLTVTVSLLTRGADGQLRRASRKVMFVAPGA
jgi:hypothetical protein